MFYNLFPIFLSFYLLVKFQIPLLYCRIFLYSLENEINVGWKVSQRDVFLFFDRNSLAFPVSYSLFPFLFFFFLEFRKLSLRFELQKCILNCVSWLAQRKGATRNVALSRMSCAHLSPAVPRTFVL